MADTEYDMSFFTELYDALVNPDIKAFFIGENHSYTAYIPKAIEF